MSDDGHSAPGTERWVDIDIYCGDDRVERLTFQEGDDFEAEVHCNDYRIEVVDIRSVHTGTQQEGSQ